MKGYDGSWNDEEVTFTDRKNLKGNINIQLYDNNKLGKDELVGSVRVPGAYPLFFIITLKPRVE